MTSENPFNSLFRGNVDPANNNMAHKVNALIEQVFYITINREARKDKQLIFMKDLADTNPSTNLINIEILDQALFERILLPSPEEYLIPNCIETEKTESVVESKVLLYLYGAYERLCNWNLNENDKSLDEECRIMEELIFRNAATANKQPNLFDNQSLPIQWWTLLQNCEDEYNLKCKFLSCVVREVFDDNEPTYITTITKTFETVFTQLLIDIKNSSLVTLDKWIIPMLNAFTSDKTNPELAQLLLNFSTPETPLTGVLDGVRFAETLLGQLLSISIMPKNHNGPYEYYENIADAQSNALNESLWTSLERHQDGVCTVFKGFLVMGGDVRNKMLAWIALCLNKNTARGQLWNAHNPAGLLGATKTVPDSFMLGLCAILLRLCKPLMRPGFKVLGVDPTYCAVTEVDRVEKNVHMIGCDKETCLRPVEENEIRQTSNTYNFVTEVFYMTHKAIDLGYRVCIDRFFQMNREIGRLQSAYQDAQAQGSVSADNIMQVLKSQMPPFLCLQNLIIARENDKLVSHFYEATSKWLVQLAARIPDPKDPSKEICANQITLPLKTTPPKILASIPEYILENMVEYLTFIRHFNDQPIEADLETQGNIFTLILVYMGDIERARNPHLRARLAEGMESLLPKREVKNFSSSTKSLLFADHEFSLQIVPNLLKVFVGIEMTGQNVQFEQKFNYRRPMYVIMEYLWEIPAQRNCFKQLAQTALQEMEAVDPPLFLRFINLLINDAIYLLDESLSNLQQIRTLQNAQDNGDWALLPSQERQQNMTNLQHLGNLARFDNLLGRDTIHTLKLLTSEVPEIFCHSTLVDRVAAMLNYFLLNLVGPNKGNFKVSISHFFITHHFPLFHTKHFQVKDKNEFKFDPALTVMEICRIYINLEKCDGFCLAVSQDGRSYSQKLFIYAEQVLSEYPSISTCLL